MVRSAHPLAAFTVCCGVAVSLALSGCGDGDSVTSSGPAPRSYLGLAAWSAWPALP